MTRPQIRAVDKLAITFLVDNTIEWMTKLPPGFTHELPQQVTHPDVPRDPRTGVPICDLEHFCCGAHGFSALIETQIDSQAPHFTLFDTGPDSRSIIRNIEALRVPVERVDRVILSHWHADHSGGMLSFLRYRKEHTPSGTPPCVTDLHPNRPIARGIMAPTGKIIGRLPDDPEFVQIEALGGVVELNAGGHAVADGEVWVSGEIPRVTHFEGGIPGGIRWIESEGKGEWIKDEDIFDERYAAIDVIGKGLVIFSACSHAGIVNVVKDAAQKFSRPVYMIIGGLHLAGADLVDRIPPTVEYLSKELRPSPTYVLPMHCSGFVAKVALEKEFGEGCVPAGVGHKVVIEGTPETERFLHGASY